MMMEIIIHEQSIVERWDRMSSVPEWVKQTEDRTMREHERNMCIIKNLEYAKFLMQENQRLKKLVNDLQSLCKFLQQEIAEIHPMEDK